MDAQEEVRLTERKYLKSGNAEKRLIDMEKVYRMLDNGMSVEEVAGQYGVSRSTLYRRHRKHQEFVKAMKRESELDLPPLPDEG